MLEISVVFAGYDKNSFHTCAVCNDRPNAERAYYLSNPSVLGCGYNETYFDNFTRKQPCWKSDVVALKKKVV
jgi:hypothetical protein